MIVNASRDETSPIVSPVVESIGRCYHTMLLRMPCLAVKSIAFNVWDDASLSASDRGL
jgi:hypothetical protein